MGKITPYIIVGYVQLGLILFMAYFLFGVPILGSIPLLLVAAFVSVSYTHLTKATWRPLIFTGARYCAWAAAMRGATAKK